MDQKYLGFILSCLLVQSIVSTENDNSLYNLVLHPHDRGAYCLDGSPAGMYLNEGVG